jgi:hypothetical protein
MMTTFGGGAAEAAADDLGRAGRECDGQNGNRAAGNDSWPRKARKTEHLYSPKSPKRATMPAAACLQDEAAL